VNKRALPVALAPILLLAVFTVVSRLSPVEALFTPPKPKTTPGRPDHPYPISTAQRKADPVSERAIEDKMRRFFMARNGDEETLNSLKPPSLRNSSKPRSPSDGPIPPLTYLDNVKSVEYGDALIALDHGWFRLIAAGERTRFNVSKHEKEYFIASLVKEEGVWYVLGLAHTDKNRSVTDTAWLTWSDYESPSLPRKNNAPPSPSSTPSADDKRNESTRNG
jgi:hypothetical protein